MNKPHASDTLKFIDEYAALCKRHSMFIESCSCCDSPWVVRTGGKYERSIDEHVIHLLDEEIREYRKTDGEG